MNDEARAFIGLFFLKIDWISSSSGCGVVSNQSVQTCFGNRSQ